MEKLFTQDSILGIILMLLATVPTLGGSGGLTVGFLVDLFKGVFLLRGVALPDEWAGRLVLVFNAAVTGVLYFIYHSAITSVLPEGSDTVVHAMVLVITGGATLLVALVVSQLVHKRLKAVAPTLVSTTARRAAGLLPPPAAKG